VLVTGGTRGIGAAIATAFREYGAQVSVCARNPPDAPLADTSFVQGDVREPSQAVAAVEAAHQRHGRLDVVVNNAGLVIYEPIEEAKRSWEAMRSVQIDAPFHVSRAAFPIMKRERYGRFVFTTSGIAMSVDDTRPGLAVYCAGKMAQFGLMVVFAAEGREHGILSNAISPVAATRVYTRHAEPGELEPEQVAPGVVFLASEGCTLNGVVLGAAGGRFELRRWQRGEGADFGREPVTPEQLAERWEQVAR